MTPIAGSASTKNMTDGEIAAIVVDFVVAVEMALTLRLTNRPTERQTGSNLATKPRKIHPLVGNMAFQPRAELG